MTRYEERRKQLHIDEQIKEFFGRGGEITEIDTGYQSANIKKIAFNNKKKDGTRLVKN